MCTTITIANEDGSFTYGRTMEWGEFDLRSRVSLTPPGVAFTGTTPDGAPGMTWTSKIPTMGLDMLGNDRWIADGINSAGLVVGLLYHPGFATYPDYDPANASRSIAPLDVAPYLLTQCTSIAEVREAMADVTVVPVVVDAIGMPPPVHFIVVEPSGHALVIEFAGETRFFDNPLRVMTNAPTFDWHEIHLRNFVNLSATSMPSRELASLDFSPIGVGSGMLGLPGDFTPPSRFVRAVAWSQTKRTTGDADEGVYEVFRELDNFNVPLGMAEGSDTAPGSASDGGVMRSATLWTTAYDLTTPTLYFHTQHNRRVRKVQLGRIDFDALDGRITSIALDHDDAQDIEDRTPDLPLTATGSA